MKGIVYGRIDLILRDRNFYLCVAVEMPEADAIMPLDVLGVDLGIVDLAVIQMARYTPAI
jgi:transposase